jgi:hypothetical protein
MFERIGTVSLFVADQERAKAFYTFWEVKPSQALPLSEIVSNIIAMDHRPRARCAACDTKHTIQTTKYAIRDTK